MVKIEVDREECSQCGLCYDDECPEVFEEDDEGLSQIKQKYRTGDPGEGEVPEELRDCVEAAADACPTDSIVVLD